MANGPAARLRERCVVVCVKTKNPVGINGQYLSAQCVHAQSRSGCEGKSVFCNSNGQPAKAATLASSRTCTCSDAHTRGAEKTAFL